MDREELEAAAEPAHAGVGILLARFVIATALIGVALWMTVSYGLSWLSEPFLLIK